MGVLVSLQSRINADLAGSLSDTGANPTGAGFQAALISFGTGLLLLVVGLAVSPRLRAGVASVARAVGGQLKWWHLLGGAGGAWLVSTQGLTVPTLGVALFLVSIVAGQTAGSLGVDAVGLGPAGRIRVTRGRLLAAVLALIAVGLAVSPKLSVSADAAVIVPALLALSAGIGVAAQQAINARVAVAAGSPVPAAVVNFTVGTITLGLAVLIGGAIADWPWGQLPGNPLLYIGGPIGVTFIAIAAWVVPIAGVLRFALGAITGQLAGGAVLDLVVGVQTTWGLWAGLALTLVAVAIANRRVPDGRLKP